MPRKQWQPGDQVTCKHEVEAYYSNYAGNPRWVFSPGMVGVVHGISPKVVVKPDCGDPRYDQSEERVVVDYQDPHDGETRRVSLNFCNIRRATPKEIEAHGKNQSQASDQEGT